MDVAADVLLVRGYEGIRYGDVAEAAGVPVASLQHHFPTIDQLRREALCRKVRTELAALEAKVAQLQEPWAQVREIISGSISLNDRHRRNGWVLWLEYWRAAAHDPALAADSREVDAAWLGLAERCIAAGIADGAFWPDGTSHDAARELHALIDGFGSGLAIEHGRRHAEEAIALVERAMRRLLVYTD